ncbi:unnamed protein product [Ectocarpus sp. 12 AP-2014]
MTPAKHAPSAVAYHLQMFVVWEHRPPTVPARLPQTHTASGLAVALTDVRRPLPKNDNIDVSTPTRPQRFHTKQFSMTKSSKRVPEHGQCTGSANHRAILLLADK